MKTIGIITINYNNKNGLIKTIESVRRQKERDFHYVIVDGGSNDGSERIIKDNADIIDNYIIELDRGIYDAYNKGIKLCDAKYILALNSGDELVNEYVIGNVLEYLSKINEDKGVVFGNAIYKLNNNEIDWKWPSINEKINFDKWIEKFNPNHQASFIKKDIYENYYYNIYYNVFGDGDLWARLKDNKVKFAYIPIDIAYFELGGISNASNKLSIVFNTAFEATIINYFYDKKNRNVFISLFKNLLRFMAKYLLRKILGTNRYYNYLRKKNYNRQSILNNSK